MEKLLWGGGIKRDSVQCKVKLHKYDKTGKRQYRNEVREKEGKKTHFISAAVVKDGIKGVWCV